MNPRSAADALHGPVSVVVIAYNDAEHLSTAVTSALAQGEAVGEVIVVDDCSTDGTGALADRLAAASPRVRALHRPENSGGCGTPRNDGIRAARGSWVAFLDSDDELPSGAVEALLRAAERNRADVAAGLCMRVELPDGRRMPWQPKLFAQAQVFDGLRRRTETVWDTLSVNKLYRRDFLLEEGITFPDGAAHYEDFTFSARVYAASPRFAVVPDTVYLWYSRPSARTPSISLRRDRIGNWTDRLAAHTGALDALRAAGQDELVRATELKFAAYDVPMYLRDLHRRSADYREQWWSATRRHLAGFSTDWQAAADLPTRWRAAVLRDREQPEPGDLLRLAELSAEPPRLSPPYAGDAARPLWDDRSPRVTLDPPGAPGAAASAGTAAVTGLPLCVTAAVRPGRLLRFQLRLDDLHGLAAAAGPESVRLLLVHRVRGTEIAEEAVWSPAPAGGGWTAEASVPLLSMHARSDAIEPWDAFAEIRFRDGGRLRTKVRAGAGVGRTAALTSRGVLLVQPYATTDNSLAVRTTDGLSGGRRVLRNRIDRLRR